MPTAADQPPGVTNALPTTPAGSISPDLYATASAQCGCDVGEGGMLASREKRVRARALPIDQRGMSQQKM
jgi:hypothetical protein